MRHHEKSCGGCEEKKNDDSTWTELERFHGAEPWIVLGKQTGRCSPRQREAVWSDPEARSRCVPCIAANDKVIPCQCSERWNQRRCPGQIRHMLPRWTECFSLYAPGHRESLKNFKQKNIMILCSFLLFKSRFGKLKCGNSRSRFKKKKIFLISIHYSTRRTYYKSAFVCTLDIRIWTPE